MKKINWQTLPICFWVPVFSSLPTLWALQRLWALPAYPLPDNCPLPGKCRTNFLRFINHDFLPRFPETKIQHLI